MIPIWCNLARLVEESMVHTISFAIVIWLHRTCCTSSFHDDENITHHRDNRAIQIQIQIQVQIQKFIIYTRVSTISAGKH